MRWFITVLAVLVLLLQYRIWLSPDGTREVLQLRDAVAAQSAENQRLLLRNQQLAAEVRNLKGQDFQALEERARSELGLIGANETYYQVVPPASQRTPATPAASPAALRAAAR
ncbi:MAG: cell division protein FtsB [Steroidobacteraceae bacterium]